jgi:hypothetical protein
MKVFSRMVVALIAAFAALFVGSGTSQAGLDNELSLVDGQGRTLTIQQWDTFLNGVFPLDRNRLTREWFHSGKAVVLGGRCWCRQVRGHSRAGVSDRVPVVAGCGDQLLLHHPERRSGCSGLRHRWRWCRHRLFPPISTPPLLPGASISANLGNGPGIQEVATFSVDVKGPNGAVAVSNAHGTVTGAAGGVLLRPYARLIASTGDSVTVRRAEHELNMN